MDAIKSSGTVCRLCFSSDISRLFVGGAVAGGDLDANVKVLLKYIDLTGSKVCLHLPFCRLLDSLRTVHNKSSLWVANTSLLQMKINEAAKAAGTSSSTIRRRIDAAKKEVADAENTAGDEDELGDGALGKVEEMTSAGQEDKFTEEEKEATKVITGEEPVKEDTTVAAADASAEYIDAAGKPENEDELIAAAEAGKKRKLEEAKSPDEVKVNGGEEEQSVKKLKHNDEKGEGEVGEVQKDKEEMDVVKENGEVGAEKMGEKDKQLEKVDSGVTAAEEVAKHE